MELYNANRLTWKLLFFYSVYMFIFVYVWGDVCELRFNKSGDTSELHKFLV